MRKALPKTRFESGTGSALEQFRSKHFNHLLNLLFLSVFLNSAFITIIWRLVNE
jgi:hypothetical protein